MARKKDTPMPVRLVTVRRVEYEVHLVEALTDEDAIGIVAMKGDTHQLPSPWKPTTYMNAKLVPVTTTKRIAREIRIMRGEEDDRDG